MSVIDDQLVLFLGGFKLRSYTYLPVGGILGKRGGILLLWNDDVVDIKHIIKRTFSLTASVIIKESALSFNLTLVYGPTKDSEKANFLNEISNAAPQPDVKWLILGVFNLIYKARDKNNSNLNLRRMHNFRDTLNSCKLKEIHLQNRKYTWSNEQRNSTLVRLDRVFCNEAWDLTFSSQIL